MKIGFNVLQNNIEKTYDIVERDIGLAYNALHGEVLQTNDIMNKGFKNVQHQIDNTNKNLYLVHKESQSCEEPR